MDGSYGKCTFLRRQAHILCFPEDGRVIYAWIFREAEDISRDYSNYMIPQIAGSLTEFTWNFREVKFAIH